MKQAINARLTPLNAHITVPGSKSITNRALLIAALAQGVSKLSDILISDDTLTFIHALQQLGVVIELNEQARTCIVRGTNGKFPKQEATIWCADAGTAARFLLAACAATGGIFHFDGSQRLRERPLASLLQVLREQGAAVQTNKMPLTVKGIAGLQGGDIAIDGAETSQFLSALLMVAPFSRHPVTFKVNELVSRPYVNMTCAMMADFGVISDSSSYSVHAPQHYVARDYVIEPDLSTASYFFAAAAVTGGSVTIQAINRAHCKQGDVAFLSVLEEMGCTVEETSSALTLTGVSVLQGVTVNMQKFSDTFMTLAALAPFAKTPTTITHIGHTRLQESDRIAAMRSELEKLQIKVEEGPDWIKIYPGQPQAGEIDSHRDHRIAMAFSIMGLRVPGIVIDGAECVAKTCPAFFEMWDAMCY